jgi:hypothetical protein
MSIARVELDIPLSGPFDYTVGDLDVTLARWSWCHLAGGAWLVW